MTAMFAETPVVHISSQDFTRLAEYGEEGIIVAFLASFLILVFLVFAAEYFWRWQEARRHERHEEKLQEKSDRRASEFEERMISLRTDENNSRLKVAEAQFKAADAINDLAVLQKDNAAVVVNKIDGVAGAVDKLGVRVDICESRLDVHDRELEDMKTGGKKDE